jgi:hypothetical protein
MSLIARGFTTEQAKRRHVTTPAAVRSAIRDSLPGGPALCDEVGPPFSFRRRHQRIRRHPTLPEFFQTPRALTGRLPRRNYFSTGYGEFSPRHRPDCVHVLREKLATPS